MHRVLTKPPARPLQLTPRDQQIIWACHHYRFLTTDDVQRLTQSQSRTKLNQRLRELWGADYLDRPEIQVRIFAYSSERPTIHALGQRGAEWLHQEHGVVFPKGKGWKTANSLKSEKQLRHRLGVSRTMIRLNEAVSAVDGYRLIQTAEIIQCSPPATQRQRWPLSLPTVIRLPHKPTIERSTKPDYTFGVALKTTEGEKRALLFLEYDNDSEDYERSDPRQSAILEKDLKYADIFQRQLHTRLYGFNTFRRLFVVNAGSPRVQRMIATYQANVADEIPGGTLLYSTVKDFEQNPLGGWVNGQGQATRLIAGGGSTTD